MKFKQYNRPFQKWFLEKYKVRRTSRVHVYLCIVHEDIYTRNYKKKESILVLLLDKLIMRRKINSSGMKL